jgi:hypothetical protein
MNRSLCLPVVCALLALAAPLPGCGPNIAQISPEPPVAAPDAPRPVTDLSQVSPGNPLNPFGKHDEAIARQVAAEADTGNAANLEVISSTRHIGDEHHLGEARLLTKKAAEFEGLSMRLLNQIFQQIMILEDTYEISHLHVPTDAKRTIVTGTMNRDGVLKELVLEQHSGTATVDKMVLAACKKGMYIHNPPPDALDADGTYKVRIEVRLENYSSEDGEHWDFKTYLGLALL